MVLWPQGRHFPLILYHGVQLPPPQASQMPSLLLNKLPLLHVSADANSIDLYHMINALKPNVHLVMELVHHANLPYLAPLVPLTAAGIRDQHVMAPAFISGEVFMANMVDYLMMQSYSNQGTETLILSLLQEWHRQPAAAAAPAAAGAVDPDSRCPDEPLRGSSSSSTSDGTLQQPQKLASYSLADLYPAGLGSPVAPAAGADDGCDDRYSLADQAAASAQPQMPLSSSSSSSAAAAAAVTAARGTSGAVAEGVIEEPATPHSPPQPSEAAAAAGAGPANTSLGKGSSSFDKRCPSLFLEEALNSSSSGTGASAATLMQVAVRSHEVGLTYHEYFHQQLQQRVLVLGLYRLVRQQDHSFFCVMTNPLKVSHWDGSKEL